MRRLAGFWDGNSCILERTGKKTLPPINTDCGSEPGSHKFGFCVYERSLRGRLFVVIVLVVVIIQAAAGQQVAKGSFPGGAALLSSHIAVAINDDIDRIYLGLKHGSEVGVISEDNAGSSRVLLQIFFYRLFGFTYVNRQNDKSFVGVCVINTVDESGFLKAITAPGSPELQQHDFAFDGVIVELLAARGGGAEARSRFFVLGFADGWPCGSVKHGGNQQTGYGNAQGAKLNWSFHAAVLYHRKAQFQTDVHCKANQQESLKIAQQR